MEHAAVRPDLSETLCALKIESRSPQLSQWQRNNSRWTVQHANMVDNIIFWSYETIKDTSFYTFICKMSNKLFTEALFASFQWMKICRNKLSCKKRRRSWAELWRRQIWRKRRRGAGMSADLQDIRCHVIVSCLCNLTLSSGGDRRRWRIRLTCWLRWNSSSSFIPSRELRISRSLSWDSSWSSSTSTRKIRSSPCLSSAPPTSTLLGGTGLRSQSEMLPENSWSTFYL